MFLFSLNFIKNLIFDRKIFFSVKFEKSMGNQIKNLLPEKLQVNLYEASFSQFIMLSFMLAGFTQTAKYSINLIKQTKDFMYPKHHNLNLEGGKIKWAFILNATSEFGYSIAQELAKKNFNLILGSFETEKLDQLKANLFMDHQDISLEAYYLYKSDMKSFEEKFHFKEFLNKFDIEVFVFNDCLIEQKKTDFLAYNYEELQYELSKKFLLKSFLFKILLENAEKNQLKPKKNPLYVFNINNISEKQLELLAFQGYEEFLKGFIDRKYAMNLNLHIYNIYNQKKASEFSNLELYKKSIVYDVFGN